MKNQRLNLVGILFLLCCISTAFARDLPDPTRTPGVANPDVTQDNIKQTICVSGWTKTIRPPSSYTSKLKLEQIKEYRYRNKKRATTKRTT